MQPHKKKPPYILIIFLYIPILYFALQIASVVSADDTIFDIAEKYTREASHSPLFIAWHPTNSQKAIVIVTVAYILITITVLTSAKSFMSGREYGDSDWADIKKLNKKFADKDESQNRIYSESLRISMDPARTGMNNNALVIGGSGTGKSFYLLTPNVYQANTATRYPGSFVFTDPKSELLKRNGEFLRSRGYTVKVLNLTTEGMQTSDCYNPFHYIRNEADVERLITNLMDNTTKKGAKSKDPFWENSEATLLQALFLFVWMEGDRYGYKKSINSVLDLLALAEVPTEEERQKHVKSPLDKVFDKLAQDTAGSAEGGEHHPAYRRYKKCMVGAADTIRSIIISANVRLSIFESKQVRRLLEKDELELPRMGTDRHTALFCVIPDSDTTYNCIAGMLYTQLFQELYSIADSVGVGGRLPIPVTFWLDEFSNIVMPDNFLKLYSTMRSRDISAVVIIQSMSQLTALYEKEWETIEDNSDAEVYLGGNADGTTKRISERTGKQTIWKRSQGRSYGRMGGSSKNEDILGRELMTQSEVRMLRNDSCIVFVRGQRPVLDYKYRTAKSEGFKESTALGEYAHKRLIAENEPQDVDRAEPVETERVIDITNLTLDEVLHIPEFVLTEEELSEVLEGIENGLTDEQIKSYILCDDVGMMRARRKTYEAFNKRKGN